MSSVARSFGFEPPLTLAEADVAAVVPAYNEEAHLAVLLGSMPAFLRHIIVVDDCSRDRTSEVAAECAARDPRIVVIRHEKNKGVGGSMVTGFRKTLELNARIVVKLDGDGQMDPANLEELLRPLLLGEADFAKGNRFHDFRALAKMPLLRRAGNMGLSFLTKAAVGYWNCFDPCNGYIAIRGEVLAALPLDKLHNSYFFETSLLARLYLLGAVIRDVPMPAIYGNEVSKLSISRVLVEFPPKLLYCLVRRLLLKNFLYDFSMESVFLLTGLPLLMLGLLYGGVNFIYYVLVSGAAAPTGTVVIPAMLITLGFQLLLSAVSEDLRGVPSSPLCDGPLMNAEPTSVVEVTNVTRAAPRTAAETVSSL